ncbi:MAG: hypothetical protein ACXVY9_07870 [Terriglobales bacterium]
MLDVVLKRFEKPDEVRTFDKGKFELVHIGKSRSAAPPTSRDGSGPSTSARHSGKKAVTLSMSESSYRAALPPPWMMAVSSK